MNYHYPCIDHQPVIRIIQTLIIGNPLFHAEDNRSNSRVRLHSSISDLLERNFFELKLCGFGRWFARFPSLSHPLYISLISTLSSVGSNRCGGGRGMTSFGLSSLRLCSSSGFDSLLLLLPSCGNCRFTKSFRFDETPKTLRRRRPAAAYRYACANQPASE